MTGDFMPTGGMDMPNLALADYLAGLGHPVHLVAHRAAPELSERTGAVLHQVPKPCGSYSLGAPLLNHAGRYWAAKVAAAGGRVVVNGGNCRWNDVSWIHYVHAAYEPQASGLRRRLWSGLRHRIHLAEERRVLRRARLLIANSHRTKQDLVERLGVPPSRVHVVYYGIDAAKFRPATPHRRSEMRSALGWVPDRPTAAFIGALGDRRKGFDTLFASWQKLCSDPGWDVDLAVIGAGGELAAWKARASAAGLEGRIRFLGFRKDVPDVLAACDVLAAPTRYEAYGQGVKEALCCGIPAIVSRNAGVAEHYPPELQDLLLPDPDDADDLAERFRAWRKSGGWCASVADTSASLREHTWAMMCAQVADAISGSG